MKRQGFGHGDVLIIPATRPLPASAKKVDRRVLAHGENGHAHALVDDGLSCETYEDIDGTLWLLVGADGKGLTHEEHGPRHIAYDGRAAYPGLFIVGRQQEYDHFAEEARAVVD
jgi:hypothetical protein